MDNFTIWVDAPSEALMETQLEDESSSYLRDEILQTQQYVFEKLDEQKLSETEKEEHSAEEKAQTQKIRSLIATEVKRTNDIRRVITSSCDFVKSIDLQLVSIKSNLPAPLKRANEENDKILLETNNEITILQENCANREKIIEQLLEGGAADIKKDAKKELEILRSSILAAKKKHDELTALKDSCRKLEAEYQAGVARQKKERESLEAARNAQKADSDLLAKMTEETVTLRSQIMELEAEQSKNKNETKQKELENLLETSEKIRQETEEMRLTLSKTRNEAEDAQKQLDAQKKLELESEELIKERKKQIIELLRKKISEAKKNLANGNEQKKIAELRKAISNEASALDRAKNELESVNTNQRTISEMRKEVSSMNTEIRSFEKQIREATKENGKLVEEIMQMRGASIESTPPIANFNDTAEFVDSDYSDQVIPPQPSLEITPIQRHISRDVFTGAPFMTSTPLQKAPETSIKTRAAARRLEQNAAAKTAEIKKRRGGKK